MKKEPKINIDIIKIVLLIKNTLLIITGTYEGIGFTIQETDAERTIGATLAPAAYRIAYQVCENIDENPSTGNAIIYISLIISLGSLGYTGYGFYKMKKEN